MSASPSKATNANVSSKKEVKDIPKDVIETHIRSRAQAPFNTLLQRLHAAIAFNDRAKIRHLTKLTLPESGYWNVVEVNANGSFAAYDYRFVGSAVEENVNRFFTFSETSTNTMDLQTVFPKKKSISIDLQNKYIEFTYNINGDVTIKQKNFPLVSLRLRTSSVADSIRNGKVVVHDIYLDLDREQIRARGALNPRKVDAAEYEYLLLGVQWFKDIICKSKRIEVASYFTSSDYFGLIVSEEICKKLVSKALQMLQGKSA